MGRMIHLIRASAVASNVMQSASKGALAVPPDEMLEILVYLAEHNKIFGQQAQLTLANWDELHSKKAAADPNTPKEVLGYLVSPKNLRPALLPDLLENPAVPISSLALLGESASPEIAGVMWKSKRVNDSPQVLQALKSNHRLRGLEAPLGPQAPAADVPQPEVVASPEIASTMDSATGVESGAPEILVDPDPAVEQAVADYVSEHAAEIATEAGKPFQPVTGSFDELASSVEAPVKPPAVETEPVAGSAASTLPQARKPLGSKRPHLGQDEERGSALQKIAKLDVKGRIQLAMKGTKEERAILVRDGTKLVALAVLESPKITDGEVEQFAGQKNVLEALLRQIPMKRRFAKNYIIIRNLVFNPRTPIDLSLGLIKNILVSDLKNLSANKEVSDTVRKLALKMFKQKTDVTKKGH